ncbi:Flp family type IVb pilin [Ramlibacter sp. 2FC]|uniref:Flp family type IVb pilin n=1 Tax=Ramlibacter sp. 2FC TaxID=2502188 RepID=UPI0010F64031|nr:Flp family type IVb pilin [Ramlibacter sp. 2FC]
MKPRLGRAVAVSRRAAQRGVTSIEYALLASLIAIAIVAGVSAAGGANGDSWTAWAAKLSAAIESVLGN